MEKKGTKKGVFILVFFATLLLSLTIVSAFSKDVGYVLINKRNPNQQILNVFKSLNLTYDLIEDKNIARYNSNGSLAKYRFLFLDDVRLNNARKIPIYNYPSIVMNQFYGKEWGLTDADGISQMTSTYPLATRLLNDGAPEVYTQARTAPTSGTYVPYYYLDDQNKAPGFTGVGRTYIRTFDSSKPLNDVGDVIAYAPSGINLINGKISKGKMCFFGIAKTKYWTTDTNNLFLDCVNYVGTVCTNNSECPQSTDSSKYCQGQDVFQNSTSYNCQNPGTANSLCIQDLTPKLIGTCSDICLYGECYNATCHNDLECGDNNSYTADTCNNPGTLQSYCSYKNITCIQNSDCGTDNVTGNKFCSLNNSFQNFTQYTCELPGTILSSCKAATAPKLLETCSDFCLSGICMNAACHNDLECGDNNSYTADTCNNPGTLQAYCSYKNITCIKNSDCGTDNVTGNKFCSLNNSFQNFTQYTCELPGTILSSCKAATAPKLLEQCAKSCLSGNCVPCLQNSDCGTDIFSSKFCSSNNIMQNLTQFSCVNNQCQLSLTQLLNKTCSGLCLNAECRNINCSKDLDCNDNDVYTQDKCNNPGTLQSYCTNTQMNCLSNPDCGMNGFSGNEFCSQNSVFKTFQNSTCVNPNTTLSFCTISINQVLLQTCGSGVTGNWTQNYCKSNNLFHSRQISQSGCANGACITNASQIEEQLVQTCEFGCLNGQCNPQCTQQDMTKCINESYSNNYCSNSNIVRSHIAPTCLNATCGVTNTTDLLQVCEFGCLNAQCLQDTRFHDIGFQSNYDGFNHSIKIQDPSNNPLNDLVIVNSSKGLYDIGFRTLNKGNFTEAITLNCSIKNPSESIVDSWVVSLNLTAGDSTTIGNKNNYNFSNLCGSTTDLNVRCSLSIPLDNNPSDNTATRLLHLICPTTPTPQCLINSDCGSQTSQLICVQDNSYNKTTTPICLGNNTCSTNITQVLFQTCTNGCTNGICNPPININCTRDLDCNDNDVYTQDVCVNPNTTQSYCRHGEINCLSDANCGGITGFSGQEFCSQNSVFKTFSNFTCVNPNTTLSHCIISVTQSLLQICNLGSTTNWTSNYCKQNNVYHSRNISDSGCSQGACIQNLTQIEEQIVQECPNGCTNGICNPPECTINSDCGSQTSELICIQNNSYNKTTTPICLGNNTCSTNITQVLFQICPNGCTNGICNPDENITCKQDLDCGISYFFGPSTCSGLNVIKSYNEFKCILPNTPQSYCTNSTSSKTVAECLKKCLGGACLAC